MKFIFYGASRVRRGEKTRNRFVVVVVVVFFLPFKGRDEIFDDFCFCTFLSPFEKTKEEEEEEEEED